MVQKQIETNKSMLFIGAYFKYKIGLKQLAKWQETFDKYLGGPRQQKLSVRISQAVQAGMKKVEPEYICSGSDYQGDYAELLAAVMGTLEEGGVKEDELQETE